MTTAFEEAQAEQRALAARIGARLRALRDGTAPELHIESGLRDGYHWTRVREVAAAGADPAVAPPAARAHWSLYSRVALVVRACFGRSGRRP